MLLFSFPTLQATPDSGHFSSPKKCFNSLQKIGDKNIVQNRMQVKQ